MCNNVWMEGQTFMNAATDRNTVVFRLVRKIAKGDYVLRHVCPSVNPHKPTRFQQDGFS